MRALATLGLLSVLCLSTVGAAAAVAPLEPEVAELRQLLRDNRLDDAIKHGEEVVAQSPQSSNAWLWLGNAYGRKALAANLLGKAGWAGKCRDAYVKAVDLAPANPDARFALMQYYAQAPGFMGGGIDKAQAQVVELEKIGPAWGHMGRAILLAVDDKRDEAAAAYRDAVAADPGNYRALLGLISIHLGARQYAQARAAVDAALARDPRDPVALYMLGRIAVEDGQRIDDGIDSLATYLELDNRPYELPAATAWWRKGILLEKAGRIDEAVNALQQAVSLDAKLDGAQKDLRRLRG
jgi:tetratricopeptide (TPR) repeat protein